MAIRIHQPNEPLTDAELDRLGDFLKSGKGGRAMNVEQLDGFFAAMRQSLNSRFAGTMSCLGHAYRPFVQLPRLNGFLTSFSR